MRHAYLLTLVPALLLSAGLAAQTTAESPFQNNQYAPTPKALEMIRYGHLSSNLNGGTMEYELPIYTIEDKDFRIPISLRYASGGFRPNQPTGEAGLGWSLMAGGAVTREIVGLDDFAAWGTKDCTSGISDSGIYSLNGTVYYRQASPFFPYIFSEMETTSDVYHFSMPGHSGNFVYHHESHRFMAYGTDDGAGSYDISFDPGGRSFTIKTGDGYTYQFGNNTSDTPVERAFTRLPKRPMELASSLQDGQNPIVSWLLTQITAPNGRKVYFNYTGRTLSQTIPQSSDDVVTTFTTREEKDANSNVYYKQACLTSTKYLTRIVVDSSMVSKKTVTFNWLRSTSKEMVSTSSTEQYHLLVVPTRKLQSLQVSCGGQTIREANLTYLNWGGLRPLLTAVSIPGEGSYSFDYYNTTNSTPPGIETNDYDFWGFYNGKENNENSYSPMTVDSDDNESIDKDFRDPDWQYSRWGMLTKITYPTGGYTSIQYEANHASGIVLRRNSGGGGASGPQPADPTQMNTDHFLASLCTYSLLFNSNTECGGVRVYSLTDTDLAGTSSTRTFQYTQSNGSTSSGIAQQFPRYYVGRDAISPVYNSTIHFPGSGFDARHIAYSRVVENLADGSKIVSEFSDWDTNPDTYSPNSQLNSNASPVDSLGISHQQYQMELLFWNNILREPDSKAYQRGRLTSRTWKNANNATVQTETYEYADYYNGSNDPVFSAYVVGSGQYWWSARREICDRRPYRTTTVRYPDSGTISQTETTTYSYDLLGNRTQVQRTVTGGGTEVEKVSYTGNMGNSGVYAGMQAKHLLQLPVEKTLIRNGKVIRSELTTYTLADSLYLPAEQYRANLGEGVSSFNYYTGDTKDTRYKAAEATFDQYDSRGNLLRYKNRTGVPTSIIYDSDAQYPLAVVYGAGNGEQTVTTQSTLQHIDTVSINNVPTYTYTFQTMVSGAFSVIFSGSVYLGSGGNTGTLSATLDGNSITFSCVNNSGTSIYFYGMNPNNPLPAGFHTLVLTAREPGLTPSDPLPKGNTPGLFENDEPLQPKGQGLSWKMTGTLEVSRAVVEQSTSTQAYTSVFFNDFEQTGTAGAGVNNSKGLTSGYSKTLVAETGKSYILGYLRKNGTQWQPEYTRKTPNSQGNLFFSVTGSQASPVDQLVVFPEDALAETYSWSRDGHLISRTSGGGQTEWFSYDNYGRLIEVRDTDGNPVTSYTYSIGGSLSSNIITEKTHTGVGADAYRSTKTFYDGLGRPFETLMAGAWLDGTQAQGSIVTLQEYDSSGRPEKQWLATGISGQSYTAPASLKSTAQILYSDDVPYSQTTYDGTPMDRVRSEAGPGADWHNAGKKVIYTRMFNNSSAGDDLAVRQYTIVYSGDTEAIITKGGYVPAGTVAVEETVDEDGRRMLLFTNMFGETVLERRFVEGSGNTSIQADTYYCYDDAGRLAGVLPPMLSAYLNAASGTVFTSTSTPEVASYAYLYRYDSRNNQIGKKLPGADWMYYAYDKGDRMVFSQDGNQRGNNRWMFHLTDKLGRSCLEGLCPKSMNPFAEPLQNTVVEVTRAYPSLSPMELNYGYSTTGVLLLQPDILSVKWYGDYSFLGQWEVPSTTALNSATGYDTGAPQQGYGARQTTLENGFLTGTLEKVLGDESNNPYIWAVTYYDNHGREIQYSRRNPMGGWDKTNTGYSYTGQPLISRTVHFSGMFNAFAERYTYSYDAWDRLLTVTHGISANGALQSGEYSYGTTSQLHAYVYDFAGRMVSDNRNTVNALKSSYAYNVRGWTERIAVGWNASNASYGSTFVEALRYQASQSPSQNPVQWGGNISSMDWKCGNDNVLRTYDFSYDGLSRLQSAVYRDGQNNNGNYNRTYTYDLHGNMLSLTTPSVTVTATYTGNRRAGSYTYDSNGNLTSDPDAGLTGMTYNALNLLSGYTNSSDGSQTDIRYTASGEKMEVLTESDQTITAHWHRFGNLVYDNSFAHTRLLVDGGYVDITGALGNATYAYRFYVQDHQGNNRMVTDANGTVLQVNHYDPYGQLLTPISSTTAVSQYKYGGKEWNGTTLSYDFGARNYLPALPRWSSMDPLAEKYYSVSPYVYCAGNPVNLVDEDGLSTRVKRLPDGTYEVVGVDVSDDDRKIYVAELDDEGNWRSTDEYIGYSVSLYSFVSGDDKTPRIGAIIDPNNQTGMEFLHDLMTNLRPLVNYMIKGLPGLKYDFKKTNGRWTRQFKDELKFYRAMPVHALSNGHSVFGTARDVGNILAGYYAAAYGITWEEARAVFDALNGNTEPLVSQEAQMYGFLQGTKLPYNERIRRRNIYGIAIGLSNGVLR